jgi:mRNA-degrading endonuclease YafQ of YafQ-DinJ toxin-antitoxin module
MSIQQSRHQKPNKNDNDCGCGGKDVDNATNKTIRTERAKVCNLLYESDGNLTRLEEKFIGEEKLFGEKKCLMKYTEENYRKYRNLDITAGTELVTTNESIKTNVTTYNKWNKDLNGLLKNIAAQIKVVKGKVSELGDAAEKLDRCYKDSCNTAQKRAITGKGNEECRDGDKEVPDACKDSEKIFEELVCIPKALVTDIDSIFKASADVVGIQLFSNIETLEPMQKTLDEYSKDFKKHLSEVVKTRETDMKKIQEELVKSVQEITKAAMDRNNARADFEGYYDAADFLCCPDCECLGGGEGDKRRYNNGDKNYCEPKLKDCEKEICEICDEVKVTFCCDQEPKKDDRCAD